MTALFAIAMGALALAPLLALLVAAALARRLAALCSAVGCVLLVIVGAERRARRRAARCWSSAAGSGSAHSALRADGLAGIFLALTGLTGGAVSLAYAELPAGRWLTALGCTLLLVRGGRDRRRQRVPVLPRLGGDHRLHLPDRKRAARDRADLLAGYLTGGLAKIGGAALLAAFALLYAHTHSFSLEVWAHASLSAGTRGVLFALFLVCFATKVGVIPLQGGLPAGYGSAPRLGAASLSVALCAGFYGLWRFEFRDPRAAARLVRRCAADHRRESPR